MRERILHAYMELASVHGLDGMTMDQVAARAGVSKRTLYRYFPAKESLLLAATEELKQTMKNKADQLMASSLTPEQIIAEILTSLFKEAKFIANQRGMEDLRVRYPQVWQDLDQFRHQRIQELYTKIFPHNDDDVSPIIARTVILVAITEVLNPEFVLNNNLTFEDTAQQLSRLLLRMMRP